MIFTREELMVDAEKEKIGFTASVFKKTEAEYVLQVYVRLDVGDGYCVSLFNPSEGANGFAEALRNCAESVVGMSNKLKIVK